MKSIIQKYQALSIAARRAFWMGSGFSLILLAFGVRLLPDILYPSSTLLLIASLLPVVIGVLALVGTALIYNGRLRLGGNVIMISTLVGMILIPMLAQGYGPTAAALAIIVVSVLASQIMPGRNYSRMVVIAFVTGLVILVIDSFWPLHRIGGDQADILAARYLAIGLVVLYLGFVIAQFRNMPLATKLVVVSLALAIVPMLIIGVAANDSSSQALRADANDSLVASASQTSALLDSFVLTNLDLLRTQAQILDLARLLELSPEQRPDSDPLASVNSMLNAFKQRDSIYITSYAVIDSKGVVIADTSFEEVGLLKVDRDYFIQARDTGLPFVSNVRISPSTHEPSLFFSAPIRDEVGEFLGVLRVRFNAKILQQLVLSQGNLGGEGSFAMLVSDENILLADSSEPELVFRSIVPLTDDQIIELQKNQVIPTTSSEPLFTDLSGLAVNITPDRIGTGFVGEFHEDTNDFGSHREQGNSVRMSSRPWTVAVVRPQGLLLAPVTQQERGSLFLGLISAVLSIAVAVFVSQYIGAPLARLTEVARQVASGNLGARAQVTSQDEVGTLASTFNQMAAQLSDLIGSLEQRVADRTKALAASADVSRRLSTILDQNTLTKEVVEQIQQAFNYYHVQIYLWNEKYTHLMMAGGTGDAGHTMLTNQHSLLPGQGLVGRAAELGVPVLVPDVASAEGWLPNPLLPETKSELAVPILLGDRVLGVLDVQHTQIEGLKQEDVDTLHAIANQVAVGLQNARTYAETQRRANREAAISAIGQRIQRTTSTEEALKVAVRELGHMVGGGVTVSLNKQTNGSGNHNPDDLSSK